MPLLHPGVGDLVDRLTILVLKVTHAKMMNAHADHWSKEFSEVTSLLTSVDRNCPEWKLLQDANAEIWQLTAWMEAAHEDLTYPDWDVAKKARRIHKLNRLRHTTMNQLNRRYSTIAVPDEKLF